MASKKRLKIFLCIMLLGIFIVTTNTWDNKVSKYLKSSYSIDFILEDKERQSRETIFHYITDDTNQIEFDVTCYWGKLDTPMGQIQIPTRHINDNLEERIYEFVTPKDVVYNATDKSVDEVILYIKKQYKETETLCNYYGTIFHDPIEIIIQYGKKVFSISYPSGNDADYNLKEELVQKLQ